MPKVHDRVLLALACFGFAGILLGGFLNFAPNRLASGVAYAIVQIPALDAVAAMTGLCGLALLSFVPAINFAPFATILAAALILWGSLAGAGHLAALLMQAGPPAARASLGPAFWILISVALLAIVDAMQRGTFGYPARVGVGAAFCMGFFLMAAAGAFDHLSLAQGIFEYTGGIFDRALAPYRACRRGDFLCADNWGAAHACLFCAKRRVAGFTFASLGILQTIPSIALFGVLIAPMSKLSEALPFLRELGINGTGPAPALVALTLYSLLPLVRGFYTGFQRSPHGGQGGGHRHWLWRS